MVMRFVPVRSADSAMVMEEENWTGGLGPAETAGRMEWRLEDIFAKSREFCSVVMFGGVDHWPRLTLRDCRELGRMAQYT